MYTCTYVCLWFVFGSGDMSIIMILHSSWSVGMYTCSYVCLCLEVNVEPGHGHHDDIASMLGSSWSVGMYTCTHVCLCLCLEVGT